MTIGGRIKEARKLRKMTQAQLAEAAEVATGTIQQYELGKREPRYEILIKISRALNLSVAALCDTSQTPIDYLTPQAIADELNRSCEFEGYLHALGYEIIEGYEYGDSTDYCLLVDYNRRRLVLVDGEFHQHLIEQSIESYAKFFIDEWACKGTEIEDKQGWLSHDPRDTQIKEMLSNIPKAEKPPQN